MLLFILSIILRHDLYYNSAVCSSNFRVGGILVGWFNTDHCRDTFFIFLLSWYPIFVDGGALFYFRLNSAARKRQGNILNLKRLLGGGRLGLDRPVRWYDETWIRVSCFIMGRIKPK